MCGTNIAIVKYIASNATVVIKIDTPNNILFQLAFTVAYQCKKAKYVALKLKIMYMIGNLGSTIF